MSLYIFDKDGTVVRCERKGWRRPGPPLRCEEQILLIGVFEKMAELRAAGHCLAIATNQEAVARGLISLAQAQDLLENCSAKLGGVDAWRLCPYDPRAKKKSRGQANPYACDDDTRKPHPGMILDLMGTLGFAPADTVMVGNSKKDREAARTAGVTYLSAKKFFNW